MDEQILQQIFDELLSSLEPLDTQTAALLQFLKAKGTVTDEDLAPYVEQAGNASNVRWLAARVRIHSLISSALKSAEQPKPLPAETQSSQPREKEKATEPSTETSKAETSKAETNKAETSKAETSKAETSNQEAQDKHSDEKPQPTDQRPSAADNDENKDNNQNKKESQPAKSNAPPQQETKEKDGKEKDKDEDAKRVA